MSRRIGLFGGTFDPVHNGHLSIAQSFLKSEYIGELWVLLTPYPPHKQSQRQTSYNTRLKMLKTGFQSMEYVSIETIENKLPKPSYTVQTVRYLKNKFPDAEFHYCMGEDSLAQFHTWKFYEDILAECKLLVAQRPGESHQKVEPQILARTHFVEHQPLDISSSRIREEIKRGRGVSESIPKEVLKIIEKEQLYK
jgi:nicotinate-nucleotide adenylyltransferase